MDLKITPEVVKGFKDKDSKQDRFRELYEQKPFIDAYAAHTDLRVADNPKGAIGREDEWDSHGKLQLEFLKAQGLLPEHRLLDIGCGVGRAARRFAAYLNTARYVGVDISEAALAHARKLADDEGWCSKHPVFHHNADLGDDLKELPFDFMWAHSVFTHLPPQQIEIMVANIAKRLVPGGQFFFTYKKSDRPQRSGLKQFQYPPSYFAEVAKRNGLAYKEMPHEWPAGQKTFGMSRLPA